VSGLSGTHINASIVNGVLKAAKSNKKSCSVVMLDLAKAFDNIGHAHMDRTLQSLQLPSKLRQIVFILMSNNSTKLEVNKKCSAAITMRRGVTQGSLLSRTVFNLCQDFVLKQIADADILQSTTQEENIEVSVC